MLNDAAWDRVYPHLAADIADQGYVVLPAAKLKELSGREPRLMAKHGDGTPQGRRYPRRGRLRPPAQRLLHPRHGRAG
ncbi:type II restriction enzyme [Corynebacterium hesseae]|uniref:type II restriction enzyme n=1 Tax=Corynebacterium hesseae TaxID=2913502 RepID=UPI00373EACD8